jgi:hypothetical protein
MTMPLCRACEELRGSDAATAPHSDLRLIEQPMKVEYGAHERYRCVTCDRVASRFKSTHHAPIPSNKWIVV